MDKFYGKQVIINEPLVSTNGKQYEDYTLEEHFHFLGLNVDRCEKCKISILDCDCDFKED